MVYYKYTLLSIIMIYDLMIHHMNLTLYLPNSPHLRGVEVAIVHDQGPQFQSLDDESHEEKKPRMVPIELSNQPAWWLNSPPI